MLSQEEPPLRRDTRDRRLCMSRVVMQVEIVSRNIDEKTRSDDIRALKERVNKALAKIPLESLHEILSPVVLPSGVVLVAIAYKKEVEKGAAA